MLALLNEFRGHRHKEKRKPSGKYSITPLGTVIFSLKKWWLCYLFFYGYVFHGSDKGLLFWNGKKSRNIATTHRIGGSHKLLQESTNADQKQLKIVFLIANCHFRLQVYNLKPCFNAYRSTLLDSLDSSRLPPILCVLRNWKKILLGMLFQDMSRNGCIFSTINFLNIWTPKKSL